MIFLIFAALDFKNNVKPNDILDIRDLGLQKQCKT